MDEPVWRVGLSEEQIRAAEHHGTHARLLAGPGTGKTRTLIRRVLALLCKYNVDPTRILALTFTRVAASQFREKMQQELKPLGKELPRISTLHSFALRQLVLNSGKIEQLPVPLRIADDWEERHIVEKDLKDALPDKTMKDIRELKRKLSAGWETLGREQREWEKMFPDPRFLRQWDVHRRIFGYALRGELVYQLKQALSHCGDDFSLDGNYSHLLVDEYQDLNACDLSVVKMLVERGMELFAAGDDDQSIYGFRYADPSGIRDFDYPNYVPLELNTCWRCDRSIIKASQFVAEQQEGPRIPKRILPHNNAHEGQMHQIRCRDQYEEASVVVGLCRKFLANNTEPDQILILMRNDYKERISTPVFRALNEAGIPATRYTDDGPLDSNEGRMVLAYLRLLNCPQDSLAYCTILALQSKNSVGKETLSKVRERAKAWDITFCEALCRIRTSEVDANFPRRGLLIRALESIEQKLKELSHLRQDLLKLINAVTNDHFPDVTAAATVQEHLNSLAIQAGSESLDGLLQAIAAPLAEGEQELTKDAVNILTMHKAKGLSSDVVIVIGSEDEFIPGRNAGESEEDELRLLYVSMSRARHHLFLTYCKNRKGDQAFLGRRSPKQHDITRFIKYYPTNVSGASDWLDD